MQPSECWESFPQDRVVDVRGEHTREETLHSVLARRIIGLRKTTARHCSTGLEGLLYHTCGIMKSHQYDTETNSKFVGHIARVLIDSVNHAFREALEQVRLGSRLRCFERG